MFNISNIQDINDNYGRNIGTEILIDVVNTVKRNIANDYIFVRYMGPKFVIAFAGANEDGVVDFLADLKEKIEEIEMEIESKKKTKINTIVKPKSNFVIASYYKGTGIEEVTKKLEEYLDNAEKGESTITSI